MYIEEPPLPSLYCCKNQTDKHDSRVSMRAILHEPKKKREHLESGSYKTCLVSGNTEYSRGRKCCMESTALTTETEKAKNRFFKIIDTRIQFSKKWLWQEGFLGKPVNYVKVKASEKSNLEVVQLCMKTYMGREWKRIRTVIIQDQSTFM